jgi:hypothetical protein
LKARRGEPGKNGRKFVLWEIRGILKAREYAYTDVFNKGLPAFLPPDPEEDTSRRKRISAK